MAEKSDKNYQVRLDKEVWEKLAKIQDKYFVNVSMTALANAAIKLGLPELEKRP